MNTYAWFRRTTAVVAAALIATVVYAGSSASPKPAPIQSGPRGPSVPEGVKLIGDIEYATTEIGLGKSKGEKKLRLDLYLPEKIAEGEKLPLVVWIHGGGWLAGSRSDCPIKGMAARGYAVASLDHRFSNEAIYPAQIWDCKAAVRWLRAHAEKYHLDPARVGVAGASSGGHLAALLGTTSGVKELEGDIGGNLDQSSAVQCVVDLYGPTDFLAFSGKSEVIDADDLNSPLARLLGGKLSEKKELAALANPIAFIDKNDPPFLIFHGEKDPLVPLKQSELLKEALTKAGVEATLKVIANGSHGGSVFRTAAVHEQIVVFLDHCLKPAPPTTQPR